MGQQGRQRPRKADGGAPRRRSPVQGAAELARRHELLLDVSGCVGWQWEVDTGHVSLEGDAARLGLLPDQSVAYIHDLVDLVHHEDRQLFQESLKQALLRGRGAYSSAFRIVRPDDGRVVFLEDRGTVDWENDYSTLRVTGFLFQIPGPAAA